VPVGSGRINQHTTRILDDDDLDLGLARDSSTVACSSWRPGNAFFGNTLTTPENPPTAQAPPLNGVSTSSATSINPISDGETGLAIVPCNRRDRFGLHTFVGS
jgi:hypothetical protein